MSPTRSVENHFEQVTGMSRSVQSNIENLILKRAFWSIQGEDFVRTLVTQQPSCDFPSKRLTFYSPGFIFHKYCDQEPK